MSEERVSGSVPRDAPSSTASHGDKRSRPLIGVDLGGTKILAGLAMPDGKLLAVHEEPTRHGEGAPVLAQIAELALRLTKDSGFELADVAQLVIGVPSAVSPQTGLASLSPNLSLPADQPLSTLVGRLLACPVAVENDVNLAAYGEAIADDAADPGSLVLVSFGTGVGMGLVINGEIVRGAFGRAGEIAYLPIGGRPHGLASSSENGLFEDMVGTRAIRKRFHLGADSVVDLFDRAKAGDGPSLAAIDDVAREASIGIAAVQALIDPSRIVIGGGIGSQPLFLERLTHHLAPLLPFACPVEPSRFGARAGLVGALAFAARLAGIRRETAGVPNAP